MSDTAPPLIPAVQKSKKARPQRAVLTFVDAPDGRITISLHFTPAIANDAPQTPCVQAAMEALLAVVKRSGDAQVKHLVTNRARRGRKEVSA